MKKLSLGIVAIMFAASSVLANGTTPVKKEKAKQTTCTHCKDKCAKNSDCKTKCKCK